MSINALTLQPLLEKAQGEKQAECAELLRYLLFLSLSGQRKAIIEYVAERGKVTSGDVAEHFRIELNHAGTRLLELERCGLLRRTPNGRQYDYQCTWDGAPVWLS